MAIQSGTNLLLGGLSFPINQIHGVGTLSSKSVRDDYKLNDKDSMGGEPYSLGPGQGTTAEIGETIYDELDGVTFRVNNPQEIQAFWRSAAGKWANLMREKVA